MASAHCQNHRASSAQPAAVHTRNPRQPFIQLDGFVAANRPHGQPRARPGKPALLTANSTTSICICSACKSGKDQACVAQSCITGPNRKSPMQRRGVRLPSLLMVDRIAMFHQSLVECDPLEHKGLLLRHAGTSCSILTTLSRLHSHPAQAMAASQRLSFAPKREAWTSRLPGGSSAGRRDHLLLPSQRQSSRNSKHVSCGKLADRL